MPTCLRIDISIRGYDIGGKWFAKKTGLTVIATNAMM